MENRARNSSSDNCKCETSNLRKFLKYGLLIAGVLLIIVILINTFSIINYSKVDETKHADVAIILGAGINENEPSPVFRERINHGIWLLQEGYVDTIILTGGYSDNNKISDAMVAKDYALSKGISADNIIIEEKSEITQENIFFAKQIMKEHNYETALIVSDPLHMKRAMLMTRDLKIIAYASPTRTSMYKSWRRKAVFLARELFFYIGYNIYRLFPL